MGAEEQRPLHGKREGEGALEASPPTEEEEWPKELQNTQFRDLSCYNELQPLALQLSDEMILKFHAHNPDVSPVGTATGTGCRSGGVDSCPGVEGAETGAGDD